MRRAGVALALLFIAAGAFEPFYLRMFAEDREAFRATMTNAQYRQAPGLREFYLDVRRWTRPGEKIAVFPTYTRWRGGYQYLHVRGLYLLTSREVLPLVGLDDRPLLENLARADAVAAWHAVPRLEGFTVVERGEHGVLLRRTR